MTLPDALRAELGLPDLSEVEGKRLICAAKEQIGDVDDEALVKMAARLYASPNHEPPVVAVLDVGWQQRIGQRWR